MCTIHVEENEELISITNEKLQQQTTLWNNL